MRLRTIRRVSAVFCLAGVTALVAGGCSVIAGVVHGARTGNWGYAIGAGINHGIRTIDYVASSAAESMANDEVPERFSPEQEYYIGRGVSASLVDSMGVPPAGDATDTQLRYLNEMAGYITVANPDGSALWRGVRVGIVESSEIGAYATPGGFVWISRGTLKLCTSEEELAAVLCHELGHVAHGHAIEAYRKDGGGKVKPNPWIKNLGKVAPLPRASGNFFGGLATRIAENRYTVDQEEEADRWALNALATAGYDPMALHRVFLRIKVHMKATKTPGLYLKNHPPIDDRIAMVKEEVSDNEVLRVSVNPGAKARQKARFEVVFKR